MTSKETKTVSCTHVRLHIRVLLKAQGEPMKELCKRVLTSSVGHAPCTTIRNYQQDVDQHSPGYSGELIDPPCDIGDTGQEEERVHVQASLEEAGDNAADSEGEGPCVDLEEDSSNLMEDTHSDLVGGDACDTDGVPCIHALDDDKWSLAQLVDVC